MLRTGLPRLFNLQVSKLLSLFRFDGVLICLQFQHLCIRVESLFWAEMSSKGSSTGKSKTKSSRAMERLKDHNTSPPRPSQSSRTGSSGAKACHSRLSHHSITKSGSRRQFSDDTSPERRPSRTRSLEDSRRHNGNRGISSEPRFSTSWKRDRSRLHDVSRSPSRRERVVRPRLES